MTSEEEKLLRTAIGQLNWVATQTRPDLSYDVLELSMITNRATVDHLLQANKVIRKLKSEALQIKFPRLGELSNLKLMLFNDASFANLPDGTSSTGGRVVFLSGEGDKCCPISWSSTKIKRVVRSTLAAETLSLADGSEGVFVIGCLLTELIYGKSDQQNRIPIKSFVDNKSLVQNVHSTTMVSEKRLRIEMGVIYEMIHDNKMSIKWIEASKQLADSLTKRGASSSKLNQVLVSGRLRPP